MKRSKKKISYFDEVIQSISKLLDGESNDQLLIIQPELISKVKKDTNELLEICFRINQDEALKNFLTSEDEPDKLQKAEALILKEIFCLYSLFTAKEDDRSKFVLAYYYDVLKNRFFAEEDDADQFNHLISSVEFNNLIVKLKKEYSHEDKDGKAYSFPFTAMISDLQPEIYKSLISSYERFILNAFELRFKQDENFADVIGVKKIIEPDKSTIQKIENEDSLEKVLNDLNELVGLEKVKKDVLDLINFLEVQKKRNTQGLKNAEITLHTVFMGPPGTGKTTVARLLGRIYKHLGYLSKGQLVETDREGLIAGYVGQTATKVNNVVEASRGGVLFIDEAYALNQNYLGNDYGSEAVSTLLKRMEDYRDDLAVVVAGYPEPMKIFIESNPGLRSRFNRYFYFDHFKPEELLKVFRLFCEKSDFILDNEAIEKLMDTFELCYEKRDDGFGNARDVRNLFEICLQNHANRIVKLKNPSIQILKTIKEDDIPEPKDTLSHIHFFSDKKD